MTDNPINLTADKRVMETIVDSTYKTKSGALNKARALQFCLEEDKNFLNDEDWIVHLDEETLLTESSIRGILNFITAGKHSFGQGMNKCFPIGIVGNGTIGRARRYIFRGNRFKLN